MKNRTVKQHQAVSMSEARRLVKSLLGPHGKIWWKATPHGLMVSIGRQKGLGPKLIEGFGVDLADAFKDAFLKKGVRLPGQPRSPVPSPTEPDPQSP